MVRKEQSTATISTKGKNLTLAIIRSTYYDNLTKSMEDAAIETLNNAGISKENISTFSVPGSWELPLAAKKVAESKKFDGILVFGVIIKGDTYHFELIADECARKLMDISVDSETPIAFEVLATLTVEHAKVRSLGKGNKGIEAANSILQTIQSLQQI